MNIELTVGDKVTTPRFLTVRINAVYASQSAAETAGYTEPTHFEDPDYGIQGQSIGDNCMYFAAFKYDEPVREITLNVKKENGQLVALVFGDATSSLDAIKRARMLNLVTGKDVIDSIK